VIEDEAYVEIAIAYVLDNPKRAGRCDDARHWLWSWSILGRGL